MLARAAMFAMRDVTSVIRRDHEHAQKVAKGARLLLKGKVRIVFYCSICDVSAINDMGDDVIRVNLSGVHTNLVMVETVKPGLTANAFCQQLAQVKCTCP